MKPTLDHDAVVSALKQRGFNVEWINQDHCNELERVLKIIGSDPPSQKRITVLDALEVHGQVYDGLFENSIGKLDFTKLITSLEGLLGRMMYWMVSVFGRKYTVTTLVEDLHTLAYGIYNAIFDKDRALAYLREETNVSVESHPAA